MRLFSSYAHQFPFPSRLSALASLTRRPLTHTVLPAFAPKLSTTLRSRNNFSTSKFRAVPISELPAYARSAHNPPYYFYTLPQNWKDSMDATDLSHTQKL